MKKFLIFCLIFLMFTGCAPAPAVHLEETPPASTPINYIAEFYDNSGNQWLSLKGTRFDINPNKVKEYSYSTSGNWEYTYSLSSVVSIDIDGKKIETCGSTVIFYDSRLEKLDIDLPQDVTLSTGNSVDVNVPNDLQLKDVWTLSWWWKAKDLGNTITNKRLVIIQSQNGDPICIFSGDNVSWDLSTNLPKTTEIYIDGYPVYIHRANYMIVDTSVFY